MARIDRARGKPLDERTESAIQHALQRADDLSNFFKRFLIVVPALEGGEDAFEW